MRKYQQLLLLIVSLISLSLLLVYRHEYNRLHYVLEVFNFFGQPCNFSDLQVSDTVLNHQDWGIEPVWQESEGIYFYSAFWDKKQEAKAIVLHTAQSEPARNCYLWFEDKAKPIVGKFKYSKIAHDSDKSQTVYFYYCTLLSYGNAPYAVSFSVKNKKVKEYKKVPLTIPTKHKQVVDATICVAPTEFNKAFFVEFLSYHKLIGIDSFIFYQNDMPYRLAKIVTNLSVRLGVKVTFFGFNYPKTEGVITRTVVENDCVIRAISSSMNVITLETNEYIVPSQSHTFNDIVNNYDKKHTSERLSLPVQTFCVTSTSKHKPLVLLNTEVSYNDDNLVEYIYRSNREDDVVATQAVIKNVASIHKYVECIKKPVRAYRDDTILKFSTDLVRSTLVQLNMRDQL